jgi:hypothetical protein
VSSLEVRATVAGLVAGVVITAGLVIAGPLHLPPRVDRSDARDGFLAAWERSRRGTFLVRGTFERRQPGGAVLSSPTELIQRPPDRLVRRFGGVSGTIGGREIACSSDTGELRCIAPDDATGAPTSYDEAVGGELAAFRDWFTPPGPNLRPRYRVVRAAEAGCFDLVLAVPGAEAPYGTDARLCFDEATGAPRSSERRFENGVIESDRADTIITSVSAADLALPVAGTGSGDPDDDPGTTGVTSTTTAAATAATTTATPP